MRCFLDQIVFVYPFPLLASALSPNSSPCASGHFCVPSFSSHSSHLAPLPTCFHNLGPNHCTRTWDIRLHASDCVLPLFPPRNSWHFGLSRIGNCSAVRFCCGSRLRSNGWTTPRDICVRSLIMDSIRNRPLLVAVDPPSLSTLSMFQHPPAARRPSFTQSSSRRHTSQPNQPLPRHIHHCTGAKRAESWCYPSLPTARALPTYPRNGAEQVPCFRLPWAMTILEIPPESDCVDGCDKQWWHTF